MNSNSDSQYLEIGVAGRPHGLSGEFRVFLHNSDSSLLRSLKEVHLQKTDNSALISYKINRVYFAAKHAILSLEKVKGRLLAEELKGAKLYCLKRNLPKVDADEFYIEDLLGISTYQGDEFLGKVLSSRPQSGIEVVTIADDSFEFEMPLVENFVKNLNIKDRTLLVHNVDDLPRSKRRQPPK